MGAQSFTPEYAVGDTVVYRDHHDRIQTGEVYYIEAKWFRDREPYAIYTIKHPTYRNSRMYSGIQHILRREVSA